MSPRRCPGSGTGSSAAIVSGTIAIAARRSDRAYVLQTGRIVLSGRAADIAGDDAVRRAYLGL